MCAELVEFCISAANASQSSLISDVDEPAPATEATRRPSLRTAVPNMAALHSRQREKFCTAQTLPAAVVKNPHATLVLDVLVMLMKCPYS